MLAGGKMNKHFILQQTELSLGSSSYFNNRRSLIFLPEKEKVIAIWVWLYVCVCNMNVYTCLYIIKAIRKQIILYCIVSKL